MATPSRRDRWNLRSGRGEARRGVARGRAQAWRRRDEVSGGAAGSGVPRRGAAGTAARRGRASSRPPARSCAHRLGRCRRACVLTRGSLLLAPGKAAGGARAASARVRMGTAGDPSSSLGACGCTVEQSGWVWTNLHSPRLCPHCPRGWSLCSGAGLVDPPSLLPHPAVLGRITSS